MSYDGVIDPASAAALASTALDGATAALARAAASATAADTSAKGAAASLAAMAKLLSGLGLPVRWTGTVLQVVLPDGTYTVGVDLQGPGGPVGPAPNIIVGTVTEGEFAVIREPGSPDAAPVLDFVLPRGLAAWTPIPAAVADGARRVMQIVGWTGGQGAKPATGLYVGATGLVADLASAVDLRGLPGPGGTVVHVGTPNAGDLAVFGTDGDHIASGGALSAFGASLAAAAGAAAAKQLLAIVAGDVSGLGNAATRSVGTVAGTVAAGDDGRITGALQASKNLSDVAAPATARTNLGLGSLATQGAGAVAITGGTVDGTPIGGTTPAAAKFTTLATTTPISVSSGGLGTGTAGGGALDNVLGIGGAAQAVAAVLTRNGPGSYSLTATATFAASAVTVTGAGALTGGGDLTANRTLDIAANGVTNAKLAQMAAGTLKGNAGTGAANAVDLTAAEVGTMLGLGNAATRNVGTTAGTVAAGDDARLAGISSAAAQAAYLLCLSM